jgi:excisionase family DNA binding protein
MKAPEAPSLPDAGLTETASEDAADGACLDRFYTLAEVAQLFRRQPRTIRAWVKDGVLVAVRIKGRRGLYFRRSDIERLAGGSAGPQRGKFRLLFR